MCTATETRNAVDFLFCAVYYVLEARIGLVTLMCSLVSSYIDGVCVCAAFQLDMMAW